MEAIGSTASLIGLMAVGFQISKFCSSGAQSHRQVHNDFRSLKHQIDLSSSTLNSLDKSLQDPQFGAAISLQSCSVQDLYYKLTRTIHDCQSILRNITLEANQVLHGTAHWPFNEIGVIEGLQKLRTLKDQLDAHYTRVTSFQNQLIL
jgi:hypothetical protein